MSNANIAASQATGPAPNKRIPSPPVFWRFLFSLPPHLYRWNLGWLFGHRLLALTYRGRRTGRTLRSVLEVIRYDPTTEESVVGSGYGRTAGWYASIKSASALRIQTGRLDYLPSQRFLTPAEAREVVETFCREHPVEARLAPRMFTSMGAAIEYNPKASVVELLASLPWVAFRPGDQTPIE